jgi:mono/diheme cytochrome c family protein
MSDRRRMTMPRALAIAVAAALGLVAVGVVATRWSSPPAAAHALRPADAQLVARGQQVYATHCAACHGAQLEGQPDWQTRGPDGRFPAPPHDARGHTWHHPDDLLFRITKYGVARAANLPDHVSAMPAYEGVLSDEEIVAVLSWIKSRWPATVRQRHDELNARSLAASKP